MISVVIPIYNAEKIILNNYKRLKKQLASINQDYEIIFEDDASIDKSRGILEELALNDPLVKVFSHYPNQGLGFTLRRLFQYTNGDIVIYLDIDLPFGIDNMPQLLGELKYADVVLASRYAAIKSRVPASREITSRLYYLFCKALFGISVRDLGSGFVIFKRETLANINLLSCGFDIHIELFAKLKKRGCLVKEIPLRYAYNGYSTFNILKHGPGILIRTLKLWLKGK